MSYNKNHKGMSNAGLFRGRLCSQKKTIIQYRLESLTPTQSAKLRR
jgi:hypothetical protein